MQPAYEGLRSRGVIFIGEPHVVHRTDNGEHWMAFFADTESNILALMFEIPVVPAG